MSTKKNSSSQAKLPKLSTPAPSDLSFNDEKLQDNTSVRMNDDLRSQSSHLKLNSDLLFTKRAADTDRLISPIVKYPSMASNAEEYFAQPNKEKKKSFKSDDQDGIKVKDLKSKISPEHTVSDFYLNIMATGKTSTDFYSSRRGFNSTRQSQQFELATVRSVREPKRTGSLVSTLSDDLVMMANGRGTRKKFFDGLAPSVREFLMDKKDYFKLFEDVDIANVCMEEVADRLMCYRAELGNVVTKVQSTYKRILERLFDVTLKVLQDKDKAYINRNKSSAEELEKLNLNNQILESKLKQYRNLLDVRDSEAKMFEFTVSSLQNEIKLLHEMIKRDVEPDDEAYREELRRIEDAQFKKNIEPSIKLSQHLLEFQESLAVLEEEHKNKEIAMKEMNNLLKAMLKGGKKETGIQVEEADLAWAMQHIAGTDRVKVRKNDIRDMKASTVNIADTIKHPNQKKVKFEKLDPIEEALLKEGIKSEENQTQDDSVHHENMVSQASDPHDKMKATGDQFKSAFQILNDAWNIPVSMMVFLENVTKTKELAVVLPYPYFKKVIYDIYFERILHGPEIQNNLTSTYVPMSDFIVYYFLRTYKLRRVAEQKLLEFLASLKYYIKHWQRAVTFANIASLSNLKVNPSMQIVGTIEDFDIYVQNFYLFAFAKSMTDQNYVYESYDGTTYLNKDKIEDVTNEVLVFEGEANKKKFISGIQKHLRFYNDGTADREGIDLDKLLHFFVEQYFEARSRNHLTFSKNFLKYYSDNMTGEAILSFEDVYSIVKEVIETPSPIEGFCFAKEFTISKAFLYGLTSGKNGFGITSNDLMIGLSRFGIDSPFPFISSSTKPLTSPVIQITPMENRGSIDDISGKQSKLMTLKPAKSTSSKTSLQNGPYLKVPDGQGNNNMENRRKSFDEGDTSILIRPVEPIQKNQVQNQVKTDSSSMLFAQHFSILRELKNHVTQFKTLLLREGDVDTLQKKFQQFVLVLDAACSFLSFPVNY